MWPSLTIFKPWRHVRPAYQALASGKPDEAFQWLERTPFRQKQALLQVHLAAVYVLFDEQGLLRGRAALERAVILKREIQQDPLYQSLNAEFDAIAGETNQQHKQSLRDLLSSEEAFVKFHAARALHKLGNYRLATRALHELEDSKLPRPLQNRRRLLLAEAFVARGKEAEAVKHYELALHQINGLEKADTGLALAECHLRLAQPDKAAYVLESSVKDKHLIELDLIRKNYLLGVAYRHLGELDSAYSHMNEAYIAIASQSTIPFEVLLELARLQADMSKYEESAKTYQKAFSVVSNEQYSMLMHEYGTLLRHSEDYGKAKDAFEAVIKDVRYPKRADACAELAMVEYRLNHFETAKALANYSLDNGVVVLPCLCLGNIALEYFHFEDAEAYFEKALAELPEGHNQWLTAQLMLAQTFAQGKTKAPEKLIFHAEQALKYLSPNDEWVPTLKGYIDSAKLGLDGSQRMLN